MVLWGEASKEELMFGIDVNTRRLQHFRKDPGFRFLYPEDFDRPERICALLGVLIIAERNLFAVIGRDPQRDEARRQRLTRVKRNIRQLREVLMAVHYVDPIPASRNVFQEVLDRVVADKHFRAIREFLPHP